VRGGAAVIRVNAHANAYADGWLTLISSQPVFDARSAAIALISVQPRTMSTEAQSMSGLR